MWLRGHQQMLKNSNRTLKPCSLKFVRDELSQFVSGEREALMLDRDTFAGDIDQIKHSQVKPMTPVHTAIAVSVHNSVMYVWLLCLSSSSHSGIYYSYSMILLSSAYQITVYEVQSIHVRYDRPLRQAALVKDDILMINHQRVKLDDKHLVHMWAYIIYALCFNILCQYVLQGEFYSHTNLHHALPSLLLLQTSSCSLDPWLQLLQ